MKMCLKAIFGLFLIEHQFSVLTLCKTILYQLSILVVLFRFVSFRSFQDECTKKAFTSEKA